MENNEQQTANSFRHRRRFDREARMVSNAPRYQHIADDLKRKIFSGELRHQDVLPTEQSLAARWEVSRITVRKAFCCLEELGLVSPVSAKKRRVIYRSDSDGSDEYHVVACFGQMDPATPMDNHFLSQGYDKLYNALVDELQRRNISFPKVLISESETELPRVASNINYELAYVLTSLPGGYYAKLKPPVVQNMERYGVRPDVVIRYDAESVAYRMTGDLLKLGKQDIRIFYHDIYFPFLDHLRNGCRQALKMSHYTGRVEEFASLQPLPADIGNADAVILIAPEFQLYLNEAQRSGIAINPEQTIVAIGCGSEQPLPDRRHCKQFAIDNRHVARITAEFIHSILAGKLPQYDINIIQWYQEEGEY